MVGSGARFVLSLGNVIFSLLLGAVALGVSLHYFPEGTLPLFHAAGALRETLLAGISPGPYEAMARTVLDERQIVYMGFVVATRFVLGLVMLVIGKMIGRRPEPEYFI
jgi:hypothetical protein